MERWRSVVSYEGYYEVSDQGRVRSVRRAGTLMSLTPSGKSGHLTVKLSKDGKGTTHWVHRLIAIVWIGPNPNGCEVSHKDQCSTNNAVSNLCWLTRKQHHRNDFAYRIIRSDGVEFLGTTEAANITGCDRSSIAKVCRGCRKSAGGYGWSYLK